VLVIDKIYIQPAEPEVLGDEMKVVALPELDEDISNTYINELENY